MKVVVSFISSRDGGILKTKQISQVMVGHHQSDQMMLLGKKLKSLSGQRVLTDTGPMALEYFQVAIQPDLIPC